LNCLFSALYCRHQIVDQCSRVHRVPSNSNSYPEPGFEPEAFLHRRIFVRLFRTCVTKI
jgi:hypothetical protein